MADNALQAAIKRHAVQIDAVVERYLHDLELVVTRAQAILQNKLLTSLKFDATHAIVRSPGNQKILRRIPLLWKQALDKSGLDATIQRYMDAFPSQIPAFLDILHALNSLATMPYPIPSFSQADYGYFNSLKLSAGADLSALVENAAAGVITRTAFVLGGLKLTTLVDHIKKATDASVGRSETIADTSISMFYAAVASSGYEKIQAETKEPLKYRYAGPDDRLTRPFCEDLLQKNLTYTRDQISRMSNGQIPNVFISKGGWNCRHQFLLAI